MKTTTYLYTCLLLLVVVGSAIADTVLYVSPTNTNSPKNCGATQTNACPTITDALNIFGNGKGVLVIKLMNQGDYGASLQMTGNQLYGLDITIQPNDGVDNITIAGAQYTSAFFNIANSGDLATTVTINNIIFDQFAYPILTAVNVTAQVVVSFDDCSFTNSKLNSNLIQVSSVSADSTPSSVSLTNVQVTNNVASLALMSQATLRLLNVTLESNSATTNSLITLLSNAQSTIINTNFNSNNASIINLFKSSVTSNNTNYQGNGGDESSITINSFQSTVNINENNFINNVGVVITSTNSSTLIINNSEFDYDLSASVINEPNDMLNLTTSFAQINNSSFKIQGKKISDLITVINCPSKSDIVMNHMPVSIDLGYGTPALCISRACNLTNTNHAADPFICVVPLDPTVHKKAVSFVISLAIIGSVSLVIVGLVCAKREILNRKDNEEDRLLHLPLN